MSVDLSASGRDIYTVQVGLNSVVISETRWREKRITGYTASEDFMGVQSGQSLVHTSRSHVPTSVCREIPTVLLVLGSSEYE
jgi:hypothetical protein